MIFNIAILTSIVSALVFLLLIQKHQASINVFGAFLVFYAIFEITFSFTSSSNNLYLIPIYDVGEFVSLSSFFIFLHKKSKIWFITVLLGVILITLNSIVLQNTDQFNSYSTVLTYFIFISLSIASLFKLMLKGFDEQINEIIKYFLFGLILNFSGSFIIYLFANVISGFAIETQQNLWYISVTLNIIAQVLYSIGLVRYYITSRNR